MPAGAQRAANADVVFQNPSRYRGVESERLRPWVGRLLGEVAPSASSFTVRFVGDREMRELNGRYRGLDRTTDVLSFPGERTPEGHHLGDVAISIPAARRQAAELGHALERELKCLLLHGVLHCLGHDHESDAGVMDRLELDLRARWIDGWEGGA